MLLLPTCGGGNSGRSSSSSPAAAGRSSGRFHEPGAGGEPIFCMLLDRGGNARGGGAVLTDAVADGDERAGLGLVGVGVTGLREAEESPSTVEDGDDSVGEGSASE